jgi:hypothetical protein
LPRGEESGTAALNTAKTKDGEKGSPAKARLPDPERQVNETQFGSETGARPMAAAGSKGPGRRLKKMGTGPMIFVHEGGTALILVALTVWLQCGGIAALITSLRAAVAANIHKLGPLHIAALIVPLIAAVVALHVVEILLSASFYRWFVSHPGN